MILRTVLDPPAPAGQCRHCGTDLVAVAELTDGPYIRWFDWRHSVGRRKPCPYVSHAAPRSGYHAAALVDAHLAHQAAHRPAPRTGADAVTEALTRRAD